MSSLLPKKRNNRVGLVTRDEPSITLPSTENEPNPNISKWRFILAFLVALTADTVGAPLGSFNIVFDVFVAIILIVILGFNWMIIPALLVECVPGLGVFPTWAMAIMAIAGWKTIKHK